MNIFGNSRRWLPIAVLLACAVPAAFGQNAQLSGKVSDPSGAVVPGVEITITNTDNGAERKLATNGDGYYVAPSLPPGHYRLNALKQGFRPLVRDAITLQVSDRVDLNVNLEVGNVTQQVTVSASDISLLRTEDAQTGQVIDNRRIEELPQYNRNALAFAQLSAGVNGTADVPGKDLAGNPADFRINGGRTTQSEYMLDGIPLTEGYSHGISSSVPSPEAIQEFKVITNGMSAEYGRLSGGVVELVTRSGTNQFHGSAYEFVKNQLLNANDFFSNFYGKPIGAFHDNVFGASLGGPIWIPKIYNGHNKTFFFLNYEGNRHSQGSNASTATVPTALERTGDFSQTLVEGGLPAAIYDPNTGVMQSNGKVIRQQFPGNVIPENRINPVAKIYASYYPLPNHAPLAGTSNKNNYIGGSTQQYHNDRWTGRLDQIWSAKQSTHFSITAFDDANAQPSWLGPLYASSSLIQSSKAASLQHVIALNSSTFLEFNVGAVRDTGPGDGSTGVVGFSSLSPTIDSSKFGLSGSTLDIMGQTVGRAPGIYTGDTNADSTAVASLGGGGGALTYETDYHGTISLQKLVGQHNLKFGFQHHRYYTNQYVGGAFNMATDRTITQMDPNNFNDDGSAYASSLLGKMIYGGGNQWAGPASLQTAFGAYAIDQFKLTSKMAVNAGVRWDFEPPRTERFNRQIFWDDKYKWDITPAAGWSWQNVLQEAGITGNVAQPYWMSHGFYGRPAMMGSAEYPHRTIQESYPFHFSPHVGIAYQVMPHTAVRMSYGLNWMTLIGSRFLNSAAWNNGYGDAVSIQNGTSDNGLTYIHTFDNPTPNNQGFQPYQKGSEQLVLNTALGQWYLAQARNTYPGYEHALQLSVQQQVGDGARAWVFEVNGSANLGRQLPWWLGQGQEIMQNAYSQIGGLGTTLYQFVDNPVYGNVPSQYGAWANNGPTTQLGRVYENNPLYGEAWTMGAPFGTSNYFSLYFQAEHRFGNGFSLLSNYTLSKILQDVGTNDVAGGDGTTGPDNNGYPQAGKGLGDIYGVASNDRTHRFLVNYSLDLPIGKGKYLLGSPSGLGGAVLDKVVGGWTLAGTTTYRSGMPLVINSGSGTFWAGIGQGRQPLRAVFVNQNFDNHVSGHAALISNPTGTSYFNPNSFRVVQGAEIGNVPSTMSYLRGPGYSQWDMTLLKTFRLWSDSSKFILRAEAQNALNHMNTANPDTNLSSGTFGKITSQFGPSRIMMVAGKIVF